MKRIIIFRFHKCPLICANRLKLLQKLNPNIPIFGMYGGEENELFKFKKYVSKYLKHLYSIKGKSSLWKWQNFDLALRDWYKEVGTNIDFEMAHIIEWDLILCQSLVETYPNSARELGITGLIELKRVQDNWSWTSKEPHKSEWQKLLNFVKKRYNYAENPYGSLGPGSSFPKQFLKKYSEVSVPELCHDELRVPLFAQKLGFKCKDTGFYRKWFDEDEHKFFNCMNKEIDIRIIKMAKKNNDRYVFHPYRKMYYGL